MHSDTSYAYVVVAEQINEPSPQNIEEGINYHDNDPNKVTLKKKLRLIKKVFSSLVISMIGKLGLNTK